MGCAVAAEARVRGPGSRVPVSLGLGDWLVSAGTSSPPPPISHFPPPPFPYNAGFRGDPEGGVCVCVSGCRGVCVCVCVSGCLSPAVHSRRCSLTRRSDPRPSPRGWGRGEGGGNFSFPAWALRREWYPREFLGTAGLGGRSTKSGGRGVSGVSAHRALHSSAPCGEGRGGKGQG